MCGLCYFTVHSTLEYKRKHKVCMQLRWCEWTMRNKPRKAKKGMSWYRSYYGKTVSLNVWVKSEGRIKEGNMGALGKCGSPWRTATCKPAKIQSCDLVFLLCLHWSKRVVGCLKNLIWVTDWVHPAPQLDRMIHVDKVLLQSHGILHSK